MEPLIGTIIMFGGDFAPKGWALCDGQLLPVASNGALFSILGTTYGGDGKATFGLPDLRGRVPLHPGLGPGLLRRRNLGEKAGDERISLTENNLPAHRHECMASGLPADQEKPEGLALGANKIYADAVADKSLRSATIGLTGHNKPVDIMQPFLGINFIIATVGLFPQRN